MLFELPWILQYIFLDVSIHRILHHSELTFKVGLQAVDGGKGGGEQILGVFEKRLTDNIEKLNFSKMLTPVNVKRIVEEADGYQPHLIAPEMGYRRLLMECLVLFKVGDGYQLTLSLIYLLCQEKS